MSFGPLALIFQPEGPGINCILWLLGGGLDADPEPKRRCAHSGHAP